MSYGINRLSHVLSRAWLVVGFALCMAVSPGAGATGSALSDHPRSGHPQSDHPRVVALDWAVAETLLVLGVTPLGLPETANYRRTVQVPELPPEVVNVGLRIEPNLEQIHFLDPDLILANAGQVALMGDRLREIAPTRGIAVFDPDRSSYEVVRDMVLEVGRLLDRREAAERYLRSADAALAAIELPDCALRRPVYLISILDQRHIMVYGPLSLFQEPLEALGLRNAWDGPTNGWGFAMVGFAQLAARPEARVVQIGPVPEARTGGLLRSRLWVNLPFVRERRMSVMPSVWVFGGFPTAHRFASLIARTLSESCTDG